MIQAKSGEGAPRRETFFFFNIYFNIKTNLSQNALGETSESPSGCFILLLHADFRYMP